jgi:hypothetical protein|tara:strand:- start:2039 stop:2299 length:261 start_codon:yes stop_codon:yes gene_type:complete
MIIYTKPSIAKGKNGFVAQICLRPSFPLPRTDLAYGYGPRQEVMTESGVRLAAYLVDLLWRVSSPTKEDTPPWIRLTLLILRVETG